MVRKIKLETLDWVAVALVAVAITLALVNKYTPSLHDGHIQQEEWQRNF